MSDESLTRIYQRIVRAEAKLDEIIELLKRPDPGASVHAEIAKDANWTCGSCRTSNPVERGNCVGCGATRSHGT